MYFMLITNKVEYTKTQNVKYINSNRKKNVLSKEPRSTVYDSEARGGTTAGQLCGLQQCARISDQPHSKALLQKQYILYKTIN